MNAPGVVALLLGRSPSHVGGLIVSVAVDPVNRMVRGWPSPNVSQERSERVTPAVTHTNSAPPVDGERSIVRIRAARPHLAPYGILGRVRAAVCGRAFGELLSVETSTRSGVPAPQVQLTHQRYGTAVAPAIPPAFFIASFWVERLCNQTAKAITGLNELFSHPLNCSVVVGCDHLFFAGVK